MCSLAWKSEMESSFHGSKMKKGFVCPKLCWWLCNERKENSHGGDADCQSWAHLF